MGRAAFLVGDVPAKMQGDVLTIFSQSDIMRVQRYMKILQGRVRSPTGSKVCERFGAGTGVIPVPTV